MHSRSEWAAAEPGYESDAEWTTHRDEAEWDARLNRAAGQECRVITRTVFIGDWDEVES